MCGISGIISFNKNAVSHELIKQFNGLVAHRGPDDEGFLIEGNVALGHRRLSIIDLSYDGHQPMPYKDRYFIVFNGEIYNYLELKAELVSLGKIFNTKSDTEVILAAYDQWGKECLDRFNGMWSFAIYDKLKQELFCSRDRFGVKPFYFRRTDLFAFGSEIKQFTALPDWKAQANIDRVTEFIVHARFDHNDETFFEGVMQLRPGHYLVLDLKTGDQKITQWYNLKEKFRTPTSTDHEKEFRRLMEDSVRLRLRSDVKVGSCLSGGLDSSTIVCLVNKILRDEKKSDVQETVSSCFEDRKFDEQVFIDEVSRFANVKSNKVFPDYENLFHKLDEITWQQDGPFGSSSIYAQWNVFQKAKERGLIVMLDGQGADEHLAGYHPFFRVLFSDLLRKGRFGDFARELRAFKKLHGIQNRQIFRAAIESAMPHSLMKKLTERSIKRQFPWLRKSKQFKPFFDSPELRDFSVDQLTELSLPMLLHYEDRNSMAFSVESRVPFLDYRLVEFTLNLPNEKKLRDGVTKVILRDSMSGILPEKVIKRYDKMGFVTPEEKWIKENKSIFLEKLSAVADKLNGLVDKERLLASFNEDFDRGIPIGSVYWRLISIESWLKIFKVVVKLP